MRKLIPAGIAAAAAAAISGSFIVASHGEKRPPVPTVDPMQLTLQAGPIPTLQIDELF